MIKESSFFILNKKSYINLLISFIWLLSIRNKISGLQLWVVVGFISSFEVKNLMNDPDNRLNFYFYVIIDLVAELLNFI
jgi:hypothetical protein